MLAFKSLAKVLAVFILGIRISVLLYAIMYVIMI